MGFESLHGLRQLSEREMKPTRAIFPCLMISLFSACVTGENVLSVTGRIQGNVSDCRVRFSDASGQLVNELPIQSTFNVATTVAPGPASYYVEIVCDSGQRVSKKYTMDTKNPDADLGTVVFELK